MKKYFTLILALTVRLLFAQPYNNTYDVNGNFDQLRPSFNIVNGNQESITVSDGSDGNSNYFILTKLPVTGNVGPPMCNNLIVRALNDPVDGYLYVKALHTTITNDVIVGGYYYADRNNIVLQPFLARFAPTGMCGQLQLVWHRIYSANQRNIVNAAINKVSLCRVYNDPVESYFFVVATDSDANPGIGVATQVMKVDAATGVVTFANTYYPLFPNQFTNLREYPGDIEYSPAKNMYMITGYRQYYQGSALTHEMFHFGILNNGNMFVTGPNNFLTQTSNSVPLDQDMVHDPFTDQFATVFTHEMNGYVPGIQSVIGFVKVDPTLAIWNPGLIWHNNGDRHNGRSISYRVPGGFAIGAGTRDNQTLINNPALQLVTNVGMPNSPFMRYNIFDNVLFSHHAWNLARNEFVLANEQSTDLRIVSTNPAGDDLCGMRQYTPQYQSYNPSYKWHTYCIRNFNRDILYSPRVELTFLSVRKCTGTKPVDSYRTQNFTGFTSFTADRLDIKIYPSVLSKDNAELTIENGSGVEMKVEVRSITGQLIQTTEHVGSGKTTVTLSQGLSAGVYMVHFYNADGNISATEKMLISE